MNGFVRLLPWFPALLLSACMSAPSIPESHYYRLPVAVAEQAPAPVLEGVLGVARLQSDGLHGERAMLYVRAAKPLELRRYNYQHWIDSPPRLVHASLISYLESAGVASLVVADTRPVPRDYLVTGRLLQFEHVLDAEHPEVRVSLELGMTPTAEPGKSWSRTYSVSTRAADTNMYAAVEAFGEALRQIYGEFVQDLREQR